MYKKEKDNKSLIDKADDQWIKSVIMRYIKIFTKALNEIDIFLLQPVRQTNVPSKLDCESA